MRTEPILELANQRNSGQISEREYSDRALRLYLRGHCSEIEAFEGIQQAFRAKQLSPRDFCSAISTLYDCDKNTHRDEVFLRFISMDLICDRQEFIQEGARHLCNGESKLLLYSQIKLRDVKYGLVNVGSEDNFFTDMVRELGDRTGGLVERYNPNSGILWHGPADYILRNTIDSMTPNGGLL